MANEFIVKNGIVAQIQSSTIEEFDYNGDVLGTQVAGEDLTQGNVCVMRSNGKWYKANATNTSLSTNVSGIALNTATTGNAVDILIRGVIGTNNSMLTSVSSGPGSPIYLATTVGTMSQTAPSSENNVVRILGHYLRLAGTNPTKYVISFNPDGIWLEL